MNTRSGKKSSASGSKPASTTPANSTSKKVKTNDDHDTEALQDVANKLRILSMKMTNASNSGHPTSCASMAEFLSVMFFDKSGMRLKADNPKSFVADRLVLSKGHTAPILYAAWGVAGYYTEEQLMTLRKFDSDLEGHPTPRLPFVDVATGSLGQGLGVACGMAYSSKYCDNLNNRYWCILGDGECAEGSVWEAAHFAGHYKLDNLIAVVDVNRLGQSEATSLGHQTQVYQKRFQSFGWNAIVVDGHDINALVKAFNDCKNKVNVPSIIIAKTFKGKGLPEIEDHENWHGKPVGGKLNELVKHLEDQMTDKDRKLTTIPPENAEEIELHKDPILLTELTYKKGDKIATRFAYGDALKRLGANDPHRRICSLDGDTKNSTYALTFKNAFPDRFVECFIAEQNLVAVTVGLSARNKVPFASTFGAFFSRAYDHLRMAGVSRVNIKLVGSHSGVSIGEDGPSQMALEDFSMFRAIPEAVVLYPSDAVSCERAVELAANHHGIVYIRTSRPATEVVYENNEVFHIGQSKIHGKTDSDKILIIGGGITFDSALKAQKALAEEGIHARVMDIFSIKPIDRDGIIANAKECDNTILTVEDHYIEGGIHEAVCHAVASLGSIRVHAIAVDSIPRSGTPEDLLNHYKLTGPHIVTKVKSILA